jgi:hypothetical protein
MSMTIDTLAFMVTWHVDACAEFVAQPEIPQFGM